MEADNKKEIKPIPKAVLVETYAEDMATVIGGDAGGIVKKIIHSEEEGIASNGLAFHFRTIRELVPAVNFVCPI